MFLVLQETALLFSEVINIFLLFLPAVPIL